MIADHDGILRVILWNDKAELVEKGESKAGQAIRLHTRVHHDKIVITKLSCILAIKAKLKLNLRKSRRLSKHREVHYKNKLIKSRRLEMCIF